MNPPGLTRADAETRRLRYGPNALPEPPPLRAWKEVLHQLLDPLIVLLVLAATASWWLIGDVVEAVAILSIVALNVAIATVQEIRADRAVRSLRQLTAPVARVWRDGVLVEVPATDIVPDDVVDLTAGDRVPADARVLEAAGLETDEALLTGESLPVHKNVGGPVGAPTPVGDRSGMLFAGTLVVRGRARAIVVSTGRSTELGQIAANIGTSPPFPLEAELRSVAWRVGSVAIAAAAVLAVFAFIRAGSTLEALGDAVVAGVALAVAAVPEGLPAIITAALALGALGMAKRGAIVRQLRAIEALGSVSVLCVDKTGTLTEGRLSLRSAEPIPGRENAFWLASARCNDASGTQGDPLEVILLREARLFGVDESARRRIRERPFDPAWRHMATIDETSAGPVLSVKGAPEVVFARCPESPERNALLESAQLLARQGARVIAVGDAYSADLDSPLRPLGIVAFADPIRASARGAVEECMRAGIHVVMVTGDHPETARAVGSAIGLDASRVVTGAELAAMSQAERADRLASASILARVEPIMKVELVDAHKRQGKRVAMTGDGVNDAPALRQSDVGVAVAGAAGTEVAREAANIVVTSGDLGTITSAIREGRILYRNLQTVVAYLLSGNVAEVAVVLVGLLLFPELIVTLLPVQLLWINLVTDGLPAIAAGLDRPPHDPMGEAPRDPKKRLLDAAMGRRVVLAGLGAATLALATAYIARDLGWTNEQLRTQLVVSLLSVHLLFVFVFRSTGAMFAGVRSNRLLAGATIGTVILNVVMVVTPFGRILGFVPLPALGWLLAAAEAGLFVLLVSLYRAARNPRTPTHVTRREARQA